MHTGTISSIDDHVSYFKSLAEQHEESDFDELRNQPEVLGRIKLFYNDCFRLMAEGLNIIASRALGEEISIFNDDIYFSGVRLSFNRLGQMAWDADSYNKLLVRIMPTSIFKLNFSASTLEEFIFTADNPFDSIAYNGPKGIKLEIDEIEKWSIIAFPVMEAHLDFRAVNNYHYVWTMFDFFRKAFHLKGFRDNRIKLAEAYLEYQSFSLFEARETSKIQTIRLLLPNQDSYFDSKTFNQAELLTKSSLISRYTECIFSSLKLGHDHFPAGGSLRDKVKHPLGFNFRYVYPELNYIDKLDPEIYIKHFKEIKLNPKGTYSHDAYSHGAYSLGNEDDINMCCVFRLEYAEISSKTNKTNLTVTLIEDWGGNKIARTDLECNISLKLGRFLDLEELHVFKQLVLPQDFSEF